MDNLNTKVLYSSKEEKWATPQDFFDKLNDEFHFTLDAAASPDNAKCANYFTEEQDGLAQSWRGIQCGAIHPIVAKQDYGLRKHMKNINVLGVQL